MANPTITIEIKEIGADRVIVKMKGVEKAGANIAIAEKKIAASAKASKASTVGSTEALSKKRLAITKLIEQLKNSDQSLRMAGAVSKGYAGQLGGVATQIKGLERLQKKAAISTTDINRAQQRVIVTTGRVSRLTKQWAQESRSAAAAQKQAARATGGARASFRNLGRQMQVVLRSNQLAERQTKKLGTTFRNLGSAAIFALGPLSGVGARLVAFQAIASRTNVSIALFAAGVAAAVVAVVKLFTAMARTTIEMDRINNALEVATGSAKAAEKEFEFLVETSRRLALDISSAGQQFAQLTAAAQGTSLAGAGVRKVFKAIASASLVLGLSAEQTTGAFRAMQQIISKGTVQAEELRGQLGERIPGAFQIAARAMGVTTAELNKLLKLGLVPAEEFAIKFSEALLKMVEPKVEDAVSNLASVIKSLRTELFLTFKLLEEKSGLIEGFTRQVETMLQGFRVINDTLKGGGTVGQLSALDEAIKKNEQRASAINKELDSMGDRMSKTSVRAIQLRKELTKLFFENIKLLRQRQDLVQAGDEQFGPPRNVPFTKAELTGLPIDSVDKLTDSLKGMRDILKSLADPNLSIKGKLGIIEEFERTGKVADKVTKILNGLEKQELAKLRASFGGTEKSMEEVRNNLIKLVTRYMDTKDAVDALNKSLTDQDRLLARAGEAIADIGIEAEAIERINSARLQGAEAVKALTLQLEFEDAVRGLGIAGMKREQAALFAVMLARQQAIDVSKALTEEEENSFRALKKVEASRDRVTRTRERAVKEIESIEKANEVLKLRIAGLDNEARRMEIRNALEERYGKVLLPQTIDKMMKVILENDNLQKRLGAVNEFNQVLIGSFKELGSSIAGAIRKGTSLVEVFTNALEGLLERLLDVALQLLIINPLINAVFGLKGGEAFPTGTGGEEGKGPFGLPTNVLGLPDFGDIFGSSEGGASGTPGDINDGAGAGPALAGLKTAAEGASDVLSSDLATGAVEAAAGTLLETTATQAAVTGLAELTLAATTAAAALSTVGASGAASGAAGLASGAAGAAGGAGSLGVFQHGGSFTVGGPAGIDKSLVKFGATRGEKVTIEPPGTPPREGGTTNIFNFPNNTNVREFQDSQSQIAAMLAGTASAASASNA